MSNSVSNFTRVAERFCTTSSSSSGTVGTFLVGFMTTCTCTVRVIYDLGPIKLGLVYDTQVT